MSLNKYGWDENVLRLQFNRARDNGWLAYVNEFGRQYDIAASLILAIASRETRIKNIKGDYRGGRYHGFGVMQVDIGTDAQFARLWRPEMVRESFLRGVQILKGKFTYLANKGLSGAILTRYAVGSYNGGEGAAYKAYKSGRSADSFTTGKNYATDVLERQLFFESFLNTI